MALRALLWVSVPTPCTDREQLRVAASVANSADGHQPTIGCRHALTGAPFKRCHSMRRSVPTGWLLLAMFAVLALHGAAAPPASTDLRTGHRSPGGAHHKQSLAARGALRRLLQQSAPLEPLAGGSEVRSSLSCTQVWWCLSGRQAQFTDE